MDNARKPLRIGILGAAGIAPRAIIFPANATNHQIAAVGARDKSRAVEFAKQYQIEKAYGSYQEVIDDPNIDVIYNALHNGAHAPWNIKALAAGKHVLSEKPSVSNAAEAKEEWLDGVETVGVTSGASVPEILVQDLLKWLEVRGYHDQQEVEAKKESLTFALPQELRSDIKAASK
jgi:hypothetical protein